MLKKDSKQTKEIATKGRQASKKAQELRKKIKELIESGNIDDLQSTALQNWAEMLEDENPSVRGFATKEVSKYLFATKKEVTKFPAININCNFIGIKDKPNAK